jgi:ADP-ribose pyrophosphatase
MMAQTRKSHGNGEMSNDDGGRTIERKVVWTGSVGSFGVEEVVLPNGSRATLAILKHPGATAVVPFLDRQRIVLLRQYRHAAGGTIWEVPAGKIDAGEDPAACAGRELLEETGFRAGRLQFMGRIHTTPGFSDEVIYLFCAFDLQREERSLDPHEVIETRELEMGEALQMIDDGEITDAKTVAALLRAERIGRS